MGIFWRKYKESGTFKKAIRAGGFSSTIAKRNVRFPVTETTKSAGRFGIVEINVIMIPALRLVLVVIAYYKTDTADEWYGIEKYYYSMILN
ncbi:MAG: hypothetical protein Q8905_00705 [Bacteroidota bacterium]|nr:hypothetical protein [Bacteroidota bacterium]